MRGYFDDEEPEREERGRDTELTLGAGALLGIFFGLVLLCGLCFGLGYALGHRVSATAAAAAAHPAAQTAAPDQEPLQASGSVPKPSANAQAPAPQPAPGSDAATPATGAGTNPVATQQGPAATGQAGMPASSPASAPAQPQSQVRPAFPVTANTPLAGQAAAPNVHPALPEGAVPLMVQVAAVSHEEDADVLVGALRKRGYTVTARREPADGLIHVRIGPFATRDDANRMCRRLLDDGYNAIVQP
jgi:cell division septation protein DedD